VDAIKQWTNEYSGILAIIALVLSLPLSFYGSVLAARYLDWRSKRDKEIALKRIQQILTELHTNKLFLHNQLEFIKYAIHKMIKALLVFMFGVSQFIMQFETNLKGVVLELYVSLFFLCFVISLKSLGVRDHRVATRDRRRS